MRSWITYRLTNRESDCIFKFFFRYDFCTNTFKSLYISIALRTVYYYHFLQWVDFEFTFIRHTIVFVV